jgi:hypothetical protein
MLPHAESAISPNDGQKGTRMQPNRNELNGILQQLVDKDPEIAKLFNALVIFPQDEGPEGSIHREVLTRLRVVLEGRFADYAKTIAVAKAHESR